jgi:hypothetical protein
MAHVPSSFTTEKVWIVDTNFDGAAVTCSFHFGCFRIGR